MKKGWAVASAVDIPARRFITEYVGEIITEEEAEQRGATYDQTGCTYLMDLKVDGEPNTHVLDGTRVSNLARYISHSCDPNCILKLVYVDCFNKQIPRVALFSK